jgi:hypothetical protein
MALDSPATFAEKIIELEVTEHAQRFTAAGWKTFGKIFSKKAWEMRAM